MLYIKIDIHKETCTMKMSVVEPSNENWCSDPLPSLKALYKNGIVKSVKCNIGFGRLPECKVRWCLTPVTLEEKPDCTSDRFEKSNENFNLDNISIHGGELIGKLDSRKAALLATFFSDVDYVSTVALYSVSIFDKVNMGFLPKTKCICISGCEFDVNSCFFSRPDHSLPKLHKDNPSSSQLRIDTPIKKTDDDVPSDLLLTLSNCTGLENLDLSLLHDLPRISLDARYGEKFSETQLNFIDILCERLVQVKISIKIRSEDELETCIERCCDFLKKSAVIVDFGWLFDIYSNMNWDGQMKAEQQKRLSDAAGNAKSLVLNSLYINCTSEQSIHLSKFDIFKHAPAFSRMTKKLNLVGYSLRDIAWMKKRIQSDRYCLGPVLYAPFASSSPSENRHQSGFVSCLNSDIIQKLIDTYLSIGDEKVVYHLA